MADMAHRFGLPAFLCRTTLHTDDIFPRLASPVLILHGRRDYKIPFSHARRLAELAPHAELVPLDCGHGNFQSDWPSILRFLERTGVRPAR